jgi:hypothetical protein
MPELPEGASDAEVRGVMSTFVDTKIKNYIVDYDTYNNFRTWVKSNAIDYNAVKDSSHAWLSYALNTASLIAKEVKVGDVVIENFKKSSKPGVFDFTVSVKDISIGDDALEENIKKVFGIEGSTSLKSELFSPDLLRVKAVALESGKVRFTVEPNDITAKSFFFKVKMLRLCRIVRRHREKFFGMEILHISSVVRISNCQLFSSSCCENDWRFYQKKKTNSTVSHNKAFLVAFTLTSGLLWIIEFCGIIRRIDLLQRRI